MFKQLSFTIAATTLLVSMVSAQSVHLRGKVEDGEGTCYYCPGFDFVIDCTDIPIASSAYDLNAFMGMQVEATGTYNGLAATPLIEITSLQVVPESFSIAGGGSIGGTMDFVAHANPGDLALLMLSRASGMTFLGENILMLDPGTTLILGIDVVNSNGEGEISIPLPNNLGLVGLEVFGQAAIKPSTGGLYYFTNPDCKVISS